MSEIIVEPPLRGEWLALHTPAERVPSHGTSFLAQDYAFDFIQTVSGSTKPYRNGAWRHVLWSLPADRFLCWGQNVYAVAEGRVTEVGEGWPDKLRINLIAALTAAVLWQPSIDEADIRPLAGNYVIVESGDRSAFYAHLRDGSISVRPSDDVSAGEVIGTIGNSGNSTMPHLHFHMMDRPQILKARGIPCRFRQMERLIAGAWCPANNSIPGKLERVRWRVST